MNPSLSRRKAFVVVAAALVCGTAYAGAQKKDDKKQQEAQQRDAQALVKAVDATAAGQPAPSDFPIQFSNDFIKAQDGMIYIPFTLTIDAAKLPPQPIALYLRAMARGGTAAPAPPAAEKKKDDKKKDASQYPFEGLHIIDVKAPSAGEPIRFSRALMVPGGEYDLYVAVKERGPLEAKDAKNALPPKMSVLKQPLTVPNFWNGELSTSTVILADKAEPLTAALTSEQQTERPYALGSFEITPATDTRFGKKEELLIFMQIYNTGLTPEGKPNLEVEYNFYQKTGEAEKYFNKTPMQPLNAEKLPPGFDVKAGHQIMAAQGIPLEMFPEGDYRVEVKISDKISGKSITRSAAFTVVGS
ncbi:MAG TPA: hypothetical protein VH679_09590 [Vicinamibacterales bacterium]|jgi:hypothetical protein